MKLKTVNVVVSEEASHVLDDYQHQGKYARKGDALNDLLIEYGKMKGNADGLHGYRPGE